MGWEKREGVVLIIDNDEKIAQEVSGFFFSRKHEALVASDKIEAFKSIDAIRFDLVVLEVNMPDGIEILKYIKEKKPKVETIIFSNCDYKTRKEVEKIGSVEFLPKKPEMSMLLDALQFVLG